ncbi:MAG: chemotaxis protein CheX [Chloroflexi bacterium]|nr:chemotaxis protein CheX [Chloroflexota bacterium]
MKVEFINPFIGAAVEVLVQETGADVERGTISLQKSCYTSQEVTAMIGVTGEVRGIVLYSLSEQTAKALVSEMMGQRFILFDELAQSGIGELGNVITGRASSKLADAGYSSTITPPSLIVGRGTMISTLDIERLVVPLTMPQGTIEIHVALRATLVHTHQAG